MNEKQLLNILNNPDNWVEIQHKQYDVHICKPPLGTTVYNFLEDAYYTTSNNKQFVVCGTLGEKWVIDVNKLLRKYTFINGLPITIKSLNSRLKNGCMDWIHVRTTSRTYTLWAFHLDERIKNFPVITLNGYRLIANRDGVGHNGGDYILCSGSNGRPNFKDCWVVNGMVFPKTYCISKNIKHTNKKRKLSIMGG